jgi:hypothetical protein
MIPYLQGGDALADRLDDSSSFVTENRWKNPFRIVTRQGKCIGMADTRRNDTDSHFALAWWCDIDFNDLKRLFRGKGDCRA